MREITSQNAAEYLLATGRIEKDEPIDVRELAGGVSNVVFLITLPRRGERFVLKQARERLRVKDEWRCSPERIWREMDVLRICSRLLQARNEQMEVMVPKVLWEDRENYVYSMTAASEGHKSWKEILLAGEIEVSSELATACGRLLGQLHAASWGDEEIAARLDDRSYFDQLRLDPYYRHVASRHPDLAPAVDKLIDSVWQNRLALVHGDFSPKNLLVWPRHMMLIDFEVGHYGDPAFDLGFFLTHLVLKSIWAGERRSEYLKIADEFWCAYRSVLKPIVSVNELTELEGRTVWNLAGCMLARVDGKSQVEYLTPRQQDTVRKVACEWIVSPPQSWQEAREAVKGTEH